MAVYNNTNKASLIESVEFTPVSDGNFTFFYVNKPENKDQVKQLITSKEVGQEIIAETRVNGKQVLVTHGSKTKDEMMSWMQGRGDKLVFVPAPKKQMDTWKLIAMLAVPGQMMQMGSSMMQVGKKLDYGLFVFAASNLLGHVIGWTYGSQKTDDEHREDFFKTKINKRLNDHLPDGDELPDIQDNRAELRKEPTGDKTAMQKTNDFLAKNSVMFGEIFLRYFGAFALAFPINRWKPATKALMGGQSLKEVYNLARNPTLTHYAGLMSLAGKTIAMTSKVPDPYDPKPHTWLDTIREKYTFRAGGWIESLAFGTMTYDAIKSNRKIRFGDRETRDYLGIVGSSMFTVRYMVRHWAKYGEKAIDMNEIRAHVTDSLAKMPEDQMPQLLAETAADLTEHFKDKKLQYGQVYSQLMGDLYRYHHRSLKAFNNSAPHAPIQQDSQVTQETMPNPVLAQMSRTAMERVIVPADKHAEKITKPGEFPLGIGA
jgi:hypothetical protein